MRIRFWIILYLIISLAACSPKPQRKISPSFTATVMIESTSSVAQETTTASPASTLIPDFQVQEYNPAGREVELSELEINPTTRLLVFDPKSKEILSISTQQTIAMSNIQPGAPLEHSGIKISPDHDWFAYLVIDDGFNIWISSIDGTQSFLGLENAVGSSFRWISNDKIAVDKKIGAWFDCPNDIQIFDPFSKTVSSFSYISSQNESSYCFPIPYFKPDLSQALYLTDSSWEVYDYKTQSSYPVLPGLDTSVLGDKYYFHWGKEGLSFAIPYIDSIVFSHNIPVESLTTPPLLKTIQFPENTINRDKSFAYWIPNEQIIGVDLVSEDDKGILGCDVSQTFVVGNLETQELQNFCLDRSVFNGQTGALWFTHVSAENRFVGWTIYAFPDDSELMVTVILDTVTGEVSYLEGYEFWGFGEISR